MPSTTRRRPLPALIFIVALVIVTALVWWRVMNRNTDDDQQAACSTPSVGVSSSTGPETLPRPETITVVVYNSTTREGIAGDARDELTRAGFRIPDAARNDPLNKTVSGVAQIRYPAALEAAAQHVRFYLPRAELKLTSSPAATGKVIVSLGKAYRQVATAAQVRAAMARANVTVEGAPITPSSTASASC